MVLYKLLVHQKAFSNEDLIINPKHFPNFKKGDIVEIYHPEDEFSRLLLQITAFKEDLQSKEAISVEQSIAFTFQLRTYSDVKVGLVNPSLVTLDSVELTFKDQYLGRSDMWRLKNHMMDTCVYLNKKIEFCGGTVRCHVYEMWSHGERVACGVISENTKIVFRSSTSMVYLFIQMSSEMWDFDIHGDLYFEKAVNGFLADLFQKWKKHGSNHEVTIVLFSRTYYEANSLEEFPEFMQECLQKDYKARYYEDFYRVAVQNERYDDWSNVLRLLRRHFTDYQNSVLNHHKCSGDDIPKAFNSNAAQGNFLEVLNMSLNVFEKHYLDRSFDRTGQLSVVITPGVGVFDVDRELTNVTKQRIIDSGVGSDLVCVGEQPLHAVPLLKFQNKDSIITADDYSMPHWINLSFYCNKKPSVYQNFTPRIKLPSLSLDAKESSDNSSSESEEDTFPPNVYDHDSFDSQVFQLPTVPPSKITSNRLRYSRGSDGRIIRRKTSDPHIDMKPASPYLSTVTQSSLFRTDSTPQTSGFMANGGSLFSDYDSNGPSDTVDSPPPRLLIGSAGVGVSPALSLSPQRFLRPGRALINPFDPSHVTVKLTSNRRRWTHIFPKGPTGVLIQQHHYQAVPTQSQLSDQEWEVSETDSPFIAQSSKPHSHSRSYKSRDSERGGAKKSQILLWGATGEQEWTPALTTGVDWKSLTIPACLPITTDYFPDTFYLRNDYLFSEHDLIPDAVNADAVSFSQRPLLKKALTTEQVFQELISQRLAQGFQLVVKNEGSKDDMTTSVLVPRSGFKDTKEYILSIGRIFHRIKLSGSKITVTRYVPRHPYPTFQVHYRYRFQAPDHATYGVSWVSFNTEKLESYKWNYLDHYICMRGDSDFPLFDNQYKFWRFRMYLLPLSHVATRKILDGSKYCDIYTMSSIEDQKVLVEGFCRFVETWVNRLRRVNTNRRRSEMQALKSLVQTTRRRHSSGIVYLMQQQKQTMIGNSPFRERLGSNRLPDKYRPRSGSKILEKGRISPATDAITPLTVTIDGNADDDDTFSMTAENVVLTESTPLQDIIDAMKHPQFGLNFVAMVPSIPANTFISYDAAKWLMGIMEPTPTENETIAIFDKLIAKKMLRHASGDVSLPFVVGFYLYYIVPHDIDKEDGQPLNDKQSFESQWLEVKVERLQAPPVIPFCLAEFPPPVCLVNPTSKWQMPLYKNSQLEPDINNKSDRVEWGHVRYQSFYRPDRAYELIVQWVAASGPVVADLIFNWARKAQTCGLQLIPIPADPLALPYSLQSDPLRGPVFIPLDIECLMEDREHLFEDFDQSSWNQRLILFQEAIAVKFGFMACTVETESMAHYHNQYIHVTGNCFLMIPVSSVCEYSSVTAAQGRTYSSMSTTRIRRIMRYPVAPVDSPVTSHQEYISRHVTGSTQDMNFDKKAGFVWSWNHTISRQRKWCPAPATADESFQDKLLDDFRQFCCNQENRLKNYWQDCCDMKRREFVLFS